MDKKTASPGTTPKCFTTSYRQAKHDSRARYIHKYYLPKEIKQRIFLADIDALMHERGDWKVRDGNLPESPPACVVHYEDLCLEKAITGYDVGLVLQATTAYWHDLKEGLSDDERRAALNLNTWLMDWEKNLLAECVRRTEEMEQRLRGGDSFLMDYEIPLNIRFYLRDDDPLIYKPMSDAELKLMLDHSRSLSYELDDSLPFYESCDHLIIDNADGCIFGLSGNDLANTEALLCVVEELGSITAQEAADPDYIGLGDNSDCSEPVGDAEISRLHHCGLFHELYDHRHIPLKHLGRIGRIEVDFEVWHQRLIHLDLQGECPVVGGVDWTEFLPARFPKGCRVVAGKKNTNGDVGAYSFSAAKNKRKSPSSVMIDINSAARFNADFNWGRYVHKYYLPLDLKRQIRPADIDGIVSHYCGVDGLDLGKGVIPPDLPDVTFDYGAYSLKHQISGETVRRVLLAYSHYLQDYGAELSPEEIRTALHLNEQLITIEKALLAENIRLTEEMERRLQGKDLFLVDYEIERDISFYLRDDDPFDEDNNPTANDDDMDSHAAMVCVRHDFEGKITARVAAASDYRGLGDNRDCNAFVGDCELSKVRHCILFRDLYKYCGVPMKHMGRIGAICADFQVLHKGMVLLDFKGERPLARWLARKEIKSIVGCYKSTLDVLDKFDRILYGGKRGSRGRAI